jgi:hypothetical protein
MKGSSPQGPRIMSYYFLHTFSSSTSIWEVEKSPGKWKVLNVETSSLLEETWRNNIHTAKLAKDIEVT